MTGNSSTAPRVVLQPRDRTILEVLDTLRVATAQQLGGIAGFTSQSRINTRLRQLVAGKYLSKNFIGTIAGGRRAIYSLQRRRLPTRHGPAGLEAAVQHQLAVNDVYAKLRCDPLLAHGATWQTPPEQLRAVGLIPDAHILLGDSDPASFFLEVDMGTEGMRVWRSKVERYLTLARARQLNGKADAERFGVLVVAHSEQHVERIRKTVAESTAKIFWFTTFQSLRNETLSAPLWFRPAGAGQCSFITKDNNETM